jgi:hypothetical protein
MCNSLSQVRGTNPAIGASGAENEIHESRSRARTAGRLWMCRRSRAELSGRGHYRPMGLEARSDCGRLRHFNRSLAARRRDRRMRWRARSTCLPSGKQKLRNAYLLSMEPYRAQGFQRHLGRRRRPAPLDRLRRVTRDRGGSFCVGPGIGSFSSSLGARRLCNFRANDSGALGVQRDLGASR